MITAIPALWRAFCGSRTHRRTRSDVGWSVLTTYKSPWQANHGQHPQYRSVQIVNI